jgi:2,3-dihydroxybenzoate decarboxylase
MKKIALEEHFITTDFMKFTEPEFEAFKLEIVKDLKSRLVDFDNMRLQVMDQTGIDIAVLSLTGPGVQHLTDTSLAVKLAHKVNDELAERIAKKPDRFRGFAHVAMQDPMAAAKELDRCVNQLQFVGALINGQTNGHYYDEEQFYPFWEKVEELDVPVYLHPETSFQLPQSYNNHPELDGAFWGWTVETATHALRLITSGLFDRFSNLKIILGHMGETLPYLLWRLNSRWEIMKYTKKIKRLPADYIKENFYVTTSGMFANAPLMCAIQEMGEDHVMFSVDYPYESSDDAAHFISNAPLSKAVREKVAYKNAQSLLKIHSENSVLT